MLKYKIVGVDFDGTLCEQNFPHCGAPALRGFNILKRYKAAGGKIILWTCRTDTHLQEAIDFCKKYGLEFDSVNAHLPEQVESFHKLFPDVEPDGRKISCDVYIDDKCVAFIDSGGIDWKVVDRIIMQEE